MKVVMVRRRFSSSYDRGTTLLAFLSATETVRALRSDISLQPPVFYRCRNVAWIKDTLNVDHDTLLLIAKRLQ